MKNSPFSSSSFFFSYFIQSGDLSINDLVEQPKQQAIKKAAEIYGNNSLKVLKDNLPEEVSYGEIKMVLASITISQ